MRDRLAEGIIAKSSINLATDLKAYNSSPLWRCMAYNAIANAEQADPTQIDEMAT